MSHFKTKLICIIKIDYCNSHSFVRVPWVKNNNRASLSASFVTTVTYLVPLCHGVDFVRQKHCHPGAHLLCNVRYHLLKDWLQVTELFAYLQSHVKSQQHSIV